MNDQERAQKLQAIKNDIAGLLDEAHRLLRPTGCSYDIANRTWLRHIRMTLDDKHEFLGSYDVTIQDTINEFMEPDEYFDDCLEEEDYE